MKIWSSAREIAEATPPDRNRYADFLRAVSILFVIVGHWLITSAHYDAANDAIIPVLALEVVEWSSWLSWIFQVMPIFFIVGGYSNAISLEGAAKKNSSYAQWLTGRLHRLLTPLLLLVVFWAIAAWLISFAGMSESKVQFLSRAALVPTWFLAIYSMIVMLAPATHALWRRWGYASLAVYILLAVLADLAFFVLDWKLLGWTNYFWVWLAMHHLGFAWRDGRLGSPATLRLISLLSLGTLAALVFYGPYPIAMAGSPGGEVSNSLPPKMTLIALGLFQFGLLLSIEKPMQRMLCNLNFWTGTVIINTMIMTVYLWHMTILLVVFGLAYLAGGFGLGMDVGSADWWITRPLWLGLLTVLLVPVALLLSPLERVSRPQGAPEIAAWRLVTGATMVGAGIVVASLVGLDGNIMSPTNTGVIALMIGGAWVCGVKPRFGG